MHFQNLPRRLAASQLLPSGGYGAFLHEFQNNAKGNQEYWRASNPEFSQYRSYHRFPSVTEIYVGILKNFQPGI